MTKLHPDREEKRLRALELQKLGFPQREIARQLGVHHSYARDLLGYDRNRYRNNFRHASRRFIDQQLRRHGNDELFCKKCGRQLVFDTNLLGVLFEWCGHCGIGASVGPAVVA